MPRYRQPIARVLGVSLPEVDRLIDGRPPEARSHPVPEWLSHYGSLVEGAGHLAEIEFCLIPALLQTRGYAAGVLRRSWLRLDDDQIEERVNQRMRRQSVLHRDAGPVALTVLLPERVLTEDVAGPTVMAEQLEHLAVVAGWSNVELRVLPADGRSSSAIGAFQLLTRPDSVQPFMACTIDVGGVRYHEDVDVVAKFADRFAYLVTVALSPSDSLAHLRDVQRSYQ
jgi:hypothetical protein